MAYEQRHKHPCPSCGQMIHRRSKLCFKCNLEARKIPLNVCVDCGKPLKGFRAQRCQSCEQKRRWTEGKVTQLTKTREQHHNWKGGFNRQKGGYVLILHPEHPRANRDGYVREHIIVWEETHGKPLPNGWIIHHLNGIKDDNRPRNLIALPNKKHYLVLQAKAKRIQELEALLNGQAQLI